MGRTFGIDGLGRIPFVATIIMCVVCLTKYRERFFNTPYLFWNLWVAYSIINTIYTGGITENALFFYANLISCAIAFFIAAIEYEKQPDRFLKFVTILLVAYSLLGINDMLTTDIIIENQEERQMSSLGNLLPITMVFTIYASQLCHIRKIINSQLFIFIITVALVMIIMSATRKAFGAAIILLAITYLSNTMKSPSGRAKYLIMIAAGYMVFNYIMNNTFLGERFEIANETTLEWDYGNNLFFKFVGDRTIMYILGWQLFINNWLTGIGLTHFLQEGNLELLIHSEYMVQLTECGIIGTIIYVCFYAHIIYYLIKSSNNEKHLKEKFCNIGIIAAILLISFTAWIYDNFIIFLCLGIVMGSINNIMETSDKENSEEAEIEEEIPT